jgi:hypothetical protein
VFIFVRVCVFICFLGASVGLKVFIHAWRFEYARVFCVYTYFFFGFSITVWRLSWFLCCMFLCLYGLWVYVSFFVSVWFCFVFVFVFPCLCIWLPLYVSCLCISLCFWCISFVSDCLSVRSAGMKYCLTFRCLIWVNNA